MIISLILIIVPITVLGVLSYSTARREIYRQVEENLGRESLSWKKIAEKTNEQITGVLKREEMLIRKQVAAISIDVKKMMELIVEEYGVNPPKKVVEALYDKIASIKVGKTGYVYIIDSRGRYVVSKDRKRDGENIWNARDANGTYFIRKMVINGQQLNGDDVYPIDYPWKNIGEEKTRMKLAGISYFKPWNVIIGASSYYSDFKSSNLRVRLMEDLKNRMASTVIGESGYIWVVNSRGEYVVSKDRERDGENIINSRDSNGVYFIKEIIDKARELRSGQYYIHYYPWKNKEKAAKMKVAAVSYFKALDWYVAPSAYHSNFLGGLESIKNSTLLISFISIFIGILISVVFASILVKPLEKVSSMANQISEGNLNIDEFHMKRRDEIGVLAESFNKMINSLRYKSETLNAIAEGDLSITVRAVSDSDSLGHSLIYMKNSLNKVFRKTNNAISQINTGADQIAMSSQTLAQGSNEQASSLEEISSSLAQINGTAKKNANDATKANSLARFNVKNSNLGNEHMKRLLVIMSKINTSSDKIKKVVEIIDDIAFQINLLALNANVEAARAGKYGKGFAVVAEEVRNLAIKSASAVKETTVMVEESIDYIDKGYKSAETTAKRFGGIVKGSTRIAAFLNNIAITSKEQAAGISQINNGLDQINQVTQSNAASSEEGAAASEELASQAQELKSMMSKFKLDSNIGKHANISNVINQIPVDVNEGALNPEDPISGIPDEELIEPENLIKLDDDDFGKF